MRTLSGYATDVPKHPTKNRKGAISFNATLNNDRRRCPKSPHSREIETRVIPAAINKKPGGRPMPPRHSMGLPGRTCTEKLQPESENKCSRPSNGQQTPAPSAEEAPASRKTDGWSERRGLLITEASISTLFTAPGIVTAGLRKPSPGHGPAGEDRRRRPDPRAEPGDGRSCTRSAQEITRAAFNRSPGNRAPCLP